MISVMRSQLDEGLSWLFQLHGVWHVALYKVQKTSPRGQGTKDEYVSEAYENNSSSSVWRVM